MKTLPMLLAILALALPMTAQAGETRPAIERQPPILLNGKALPFSSAVRAGDMLYLAGQVGMDANGRLPDGIAAQARMTLDGIGASLKTAGLGWKDVVRCMVFLRDMNDWAAFNTVYAGYVDPDHLPARSALGVSGLALGALVEVQCDAYAPGK